ncbi:MATE family efflux transporter [bacterium]|nr:MAG: MATE family efflux transporter [bacterium]
MSTVVENAPHPGPGPVKSATRTVWQLAGPAVALNSLQVINNLLDRGFIGHLEGSALTAHGMAQSVTFLMFSLTVALGTGATAIVARAYGAGHTSEYRRASRHAFRLAVMMGLIVSVLTFFSAGPMAKALLPADNPRAAELMAQFVRAFALGLPGIAIIQTLAGCLRGIGDTRSPMVISGVQILLHIALNYLLIFPPVGLGLAGAGYALSISALLASGVYAWYVSRTPLRRVLYFQLPGIEWARRILRIAIPAAFMAILRVASFSLFTLVLALVPDSSDAIAGMSMAIAIESIMFMPAFGLSMAASALVGQNLGAKDPENAERLGWAAARSAAWVTLALAGPIFLAAPSAIGFMCGYKADVIAFGAPLLRWLCATEVAFAIAMVLQGAMQGAGDTVRPMWISLVSLWLLRVPLAYILALHVGDRLIGPITMPVGVGLGALGAWISISGTQAIQGFLSMIAFQQGRWKEKKV